MTTNPSEAAQRTDSSSWSDTVLNHRCKAACGSNCTDPEAKNLREFDIDWNTLDGTSKYV